MTPTRRLLAAAIVVLVLLGVAVAAGSQFGARERRSASTVSEAVASVEVESASGAVEVVGGAGGEIKVQRTERYLLGAPTVRQSVIDGVLRVQARCPRLGAAACEVRLRLDLPATTALRVRSVRGTVSVTGIAGAVDVVTGSGAVSLTRTAGPVTARTSAGAIRGVDLAPVFMDASTRAGSIRLSLAEPSARVDLATQAGGIDVALPPDRYRVEATTGAGQADVSVDVDPTSKYTVRAKAAAGPVRIHTR